ncbi:MAG TPA: hypothetical protein VNM14_03860 [Planctomycetota bacterium]|jgi:hypothetical protein|nr:hypothetical protein [Planctomycetota bacterium]
MKYVLVALPFLALSSAAWAGDVPCLPTRMSIDEEPRERQDVENERQRPDESTRLTPMEFFFRHSELEAGALYTDFDGSLSLKSHLGYYVRYGVEIAPRVSVHLTYRFNTYGNGPRSAAVQEDVKIQNLLFGATYTQPLSRDFAVLGSLGIGPTWFDSSVVRGDIGFTVSGELAATARLYEFLRFKAGLVVDGVNTNFHGASGMQVNLSWLFGLEIGM